jgi:hypothetical protein
MTGQSSRDGELYKNVSLAAFVPLLFLICFSAIIEHIDGRLGLRFKFRMGSDIFDITQLKVVKKQLHLHFAVDAELMERLWSRD